MKNLAVREAAMPLPGKKGRSLLSYWQLYALLLPGLVYFLVYKYLPMFGIIVAFKDFKPLLGILDSPWAGWKYFDRLFSSHDFLNVVKNTIIISVYKLIFYFPVPIILALMINELANLRFKKVSQTILYLPHFLSWVIMGGIVTTVLSSRGVINHLRSLAGLDAFIFLASPQAFRGIIVLSSIWKEAGWGTIVFLAAITSLNPELYEAATMDGAGVFRKMWNVTIPGISGTIAIMFILRLGSLMDAGFEQILVLYNPAVYSVGDILGTYVYRVGIQNGQYSLTVAADIFKGVINLFMVASSNAIIKKLGGEGIW